MQASATAGSTRQPAIGFLGEELLEIQRAASSIPNDERQRLPDWNSAAAPKQAFMPGNDQGPNGSTLEAMSSATPAMTSTATAPTPATTRSAKGASTTFAASRPLRPGFVNH